jgi:hypothetical protein
MGETRTPHDGSVRCDCSACIRKDPSRAQQLSTPIQQEVGSRVEPASVAENYRRTWFVYDSPSRAIAKCWAEDSAVRIASALNSADADAFRLSLERAKVTVRDQFIRDVRGVLQLARVELVALADDESVEDVAETLSVIDDIEARAKDLFGEGP